MTAAPAEQTLQYIEIIKEELIAAPAAIVFETLLEQIGPLNEKPDGEPIPMKIEAWPGGRWYRDLGNNTGHLWAHVQSIKPPSLLEFYGPLFMSSSAMSNVTYRLTEERGITRMQFSHRASGLITHPLEAMNGGWGSMHARVRKFAELRARETK
jgi:Activator of Hsp90 ATPase homolog 1-like protein